MNDGCSSWTIARSTAAGQTLLLRQSSPLNCHDYVQCNNAYYAGYAYCLVYTTEDTVATDDYNSYGSYFLGSYTIPSFQTTSEAGAAIVNAVQQKMVPKVVLSNILEYFPNTVVGDNTEGTVSSFSSTGLSNELAIKPEGVLHDLFPCTAEPRSAHSLRGVLGDVDGRPLYCGLRGPPYRGKIRY